MKLGVNLDHIATLRQARYRSTRHVSQHAEPVLSEMLHIAEHAGAHSITVHLREDRRHIQDDDVHMVKAECRLPLNLEMSMHEDIVKIALKIRPEEVCLVPERREEVTTEGGLDVTHGGPRLHKTIESLRSHKIAVSLFVSPDSSQIRSASTSGAEFIELNTGAYAEAHHATDVKRELKRLRDSAELAHALGLRVNAGHGINYKNIGPILEIPHLETLNIGHSIICRGLVVGFEEAVREMVSMIRISDQN